MNGARSVLSLPIASIAISADRVGFFSAAHASALGADIAAHGQHDPIHVRRNGNAAKLPWTLVAGLHRLRGVEAAGLVEIDAIQVADASTSELDLRRLELSENLDHRHRRPIERAIFMYERARIEEEVDYPDHVGESSQVRAGRARQSASVTITDAGGWRERTAAAMGCSLATFEKHQRLYREIVEALPDLAERLNFHPLGESLKAMTVLAKVKEPSQRRKLADKLLSRTDWKSIKEVLVEDGFHVCNGRRVTDHCMRIHDTWAAMDLDEKRATVRWLADEALTHGMADELVARLRESGRLPSPNREHGR